MEETLRGDSRGESATGWTRLAAVLEVIGVLLTAIFLGRAVRAGLGIESWKAVQGAMVESGEPDFWKLAWLATVEQTFKYGFAFLLFYAIGRWHRRRPLPAYGFRLGERSCGRLAAIGVVLWAGLGILPNGLQLLAARFPVLGAGPEHWSLFPSTWSLPFIAYMAASSFLLVPIVEELYARGYMVTRLAEDYGRGGAVLLSALFFALAHGQYFKAEVLSLGMLVSIVLGSILSGYVFLRTGSLLPVVVAHALVNVPTPPVDWGQEAMVLAMVVVLAMSWRPGLEWLRGAFELVAGTRWSWFTLGTVLLVASLLVVAIGASWLPYAAAGMVLVSLTVHVVDRRRPASSG